MFDQPDYSIPCCAICPYELHGADYGRLACWKCEGSMYERLNDVGTYWAKLPSSVHRPVGERSPGRSMSVYPGIPGNGNVINLTAGGGDTPLGQLLAVEEDWRRVRGWAVQTWRGNVAQTMPKVLKFLRNNLPWACAAHKNPPLLSDGTALLPDVQVLYEALGPIVGALRRAVNDEPPVRLFASRCLAPYVAGFECAGRVRVGVDAEPKWCPECGTPWDRETWLRWAQSSGELGAAA